MNSKKVKILIDNKIIDAILETDKLFLGGEKVTYEIDKNTKGVVSKKLVKIIK